MFFLGVKDVLSLPLSNDMLRHNHHSKKTISPISSPASEVALPKAGVDFTNLVSFSSSSAMGLWRRPSWVPCFFFLRFKKSGNFEEFRNLIWKLDKTGWFNARKSQKTGKQNSRYCNVGVVMLRRILYINIYQLYQISISKSSISN